MPRNLRNRSGQPLYNRCGWVLAQCAACGTLNYVEPHGTTAACVCSPAWTEHTPIPHEYRNHAGAHLARPVPKGA